MSKTLRRSRNKSRRLTRRNSFRRLFRTRWWYRKSYRSSQSNRSIRVIVRGRTINLVVKMAAVTITPRLNSSGRTWPTHQIPDILAEIQLTYKMHQFHPERIMNKYSIVTSKSCQRLHPSTRNGGQLFNTLNRRNRMSNLKSRRRTSIKRKAKTLRLCCWSKFRRTCTFWKRMIRNIWVSWIIRKSRNNKENTTKM